MSFRIKNWLEYQHYGDKKTVPWIKLHYELLSSEDWSGWDNNAKLLALVCMMIASRHKGDVPNNPKHVQRLGNLDKLPDFKPLISCGFLESKEVGLNLTESRQSETLESPSVSISSSLSDSGKGVKGEKPEPNGFRDFWNIFPRQRIGSQPDAIRAYLSALKKATEEELLKACDAYRNSSDVQRGFAKGAAAWLNAEGWNNDYSIQPQGTQNGTIQRTTNQTKFNPASAAISFAQSLETDGASWPGGDY